MLSVFVFLPAIVLAHCELASPFPFKSRFDPANQQSQNIDFSMTAPLNADGSNFPCKGYHTELDATPVKATLVAGSSFPVSISQGAVHDGGSCEFSVSYDKGQNFAVIYRLVGGCPLTADFSIDIPSNLPAADKALLSWSWNNKVGNREEYQNCAAVKITNKETFKSYTAPAIYRINTYADGTCISKEGISIQYPHVNSVKTVFAAGMSASSPVTDIANCPRELSPMITVTSSGSTNVAPPAQAPPQPPLASSKPAPSQEPAAGNQPVSRPPISVIVQLPQTTISRPRNRPSRSRRLPTQTKVNVVPAVIPTRAALAKCESGTIICSPDGYSFSMCDQGLPVAMGSVALGTVCKEGTIIGDRSYHIARSIYRKRRIS